MSGEEAIRHAARNVEVVDLKRVKRAGGADAAGRGGSSHEDRLREINDTHALIMVGGNALVLREGAGPDGRFEPQLLQIRAVREYFANQRVTVGDKDKSIFELWLQWPERRTYEGMTFAPQGAPDGYYNMWSGFSVEPSPVASPGRISLFLDHLRVNICQEDDGLCRWVTGWLAHLVQKPHEKPGTALVMRGGMGVGKTVVGKIVGSLFPRHHRIVSSPKHVVGNFNAHMANLLLLQADEGFWAGDKTAEAVVKDLVTNDVMMMEKKGVDAIQMPNYLRLMVTSNSDWVVPAGMEERRFCVLDIGKAAQQNIEYFAEMERQMENGGREALLRYLLDFDLSTVDLRRIPRTAALDEQVVHGLELVPGWWFERLHEGTITHNADVWPETVSKKALYADLIAHAERTGRKFRGGSPQLGAHLKKLVPGITDARPRDAHGGNGERVWVLPSLWSCREAFDAMTGMRTEWPADE